MITHSLTAQEVVNDTLFIQGEDIQLAELQNRSTGQRIELKEVEFGLYVHPLSNSFRGTYTLSVFRDRKRFVRTIEDTVKFNPNPVAYVERYYFERTTNNWKSEGYCNKAEAVVYIETYMTDLITKNGKENTLKIYQIKEGIKTLVYESY